MLGTIDIAIIIAYFIALILIGYFSSKRQTSEDYLIAKRGLGTWSTMATVNASKTGSILMTFVAMTYLWGFSAVWYFIGAIIGVILFIPFAKHLKKKSTKKYYTLADYFKNNYGKTSAKFASGLTIFLMFGLAAINLIAASKLFTYFTGLSFWIGAIIMTLVIVSYLYLAGFKAVARTDILQYGAMVGIIIILALLLFNGSFIPASEWNFFAADMGTVVGFFIVGILFPFASPDLWQRVYAAKGKKEIRNGLWLSVGVYAIFCLLLALIAITVKTAFPGIDPDIALIHGFQNMLPAGLVGLATVLLFSAIMSTLDTYIYTGASSIVQDLFNFKKEKAVKAIKYTILTLAAICTIVAISIQSLIIGSYIFVAFYSVLAIPAMTSGIYKRIKSTAITGAFIVGIIASVVMLIMSLIKGTVEPIIIIGAIIASLIGLFVGSVFFKRKKFSS